MASFLTDPSHDLDYQITALIAVIAGVPALRAQWRDLSEWLTSWNSLLNQALAEIRSGQQEGEDVARHEFLTLADDVARAAMLTLARSCTSEVPTIQMSRWPLFANHLHGLHAIRGGRQGVAWSGKRAEISGRLPILSLTPNGERVRQRLVVDVLELPILAWSVAVTELNSLGEGLIWRA